MIKNIAVICGGYSGENVISKQSGAVVYKHLLNSKYNPVLVVIDRQNWFAYVNNNALPIDKNDFTFNIEGKKQSFDGAFIAIHGSPGENGLLQGYFEMLGIKYNSGSVFASSLTFNKKFCNDLLKQYGINSAKSISLLKNQSILPDDIEKTLGLPCFVKPNKGGSSLGVTKVKSINELLPAIQKAFNEDDEIVIEQFIEGVEVTCGVINYKGQIKSIGITEIVSENEFFDFEAKYHDAKTQEITPARINPEMYRKIEEITVNIYTILRFKGIIRADFIIKNNTPYLIEVNTVPGLSEASIVPKQAQFSQITLTQLFENECEQMFI